MMTPAHVQLLVLGLAWSLAFRRTLAAFVVPPTRMDGQLHLVVALGLLALGLTRARRDFGVKALALQPHARPGPAALAFAAAGMHALNPYTIDVHALDGILFVVGTFGLAGMVLSPARLRAAIPLAIAGLCALPIADVLDVYLGFPLRLATAELVHAALHPLGIGELATETIVLLEGRGVQVDLPCSGVRSLWSGALFWSAATWIERRRIGSAWLLAGAVFAITLVAGNGVRVLVIVVLHGASATTAERLLHAPLGLVVFVAACALGWGLLRLLPRDDVPHGDEHDRRADARLPLVLTAALVLLGLVPAPPAPPEATPNRITLAEPWAHAEPLTPEEAGLFRSRTVQAVGKWRIDDGPLRGQLVLVMSRSWRAQHRPDACHRAAGRRVEHDVPILVAPGFPARRLDLATGSTPALGVYWFQSATATTDDHGARIWAALDGDAEPWVMASLALETPRPTTDPDLLALLTRIHTDVEHVLQGAPP